MPRSLKVHPSHKPTLLQALARNGFLTQGALAGHLGMALSTVNNFINSRPVYLSNVEIICDALGLDPAELIHPIAAQPEDQPDTVTHPSLSFSSYDAAWVGREETVQRLSQLLQDSKRLLLILGLTGIGKTALAERLILELSTAREHIEDPPKSPLKRGTSLIPPFSSRGFSKSRAIFKRKVNFLK